MNDNKRFNGKKVFLAFRTNLFSTNTDEHMTLKFFGNHPEWNEVIREAEQWQQMLPVGISQSGIGVWKNRDLYHEVAHMTFEGHPSLFGRNWHITLASSANPIVPRLYVEATRYGYDLIAKELWVGYKDSVTNEKKWITYKNAKHLVRSEQTVRSN